MNANPRQIMSSPFIDYVYLMASAKEQSQTTVNMAMQWADKHLMKWTTSKSYWIKLPFQIKMGGEKLTNVEYTA